MKYKTYSLIPFFAVGLVIFFSACSGNTNKQHEETQTIEEVKEDLYSLNTDSIDLRWTAFKTTSKLAVGGAFDSIRVYGPHTKEGTIQQLLLGAKLEIFTSSINSNNIIRDEKLSNIFFGNDSSNKIIATIGSVGADNSVEISLAMNGTLKQLKGSYVLDNNTLTLTTSVDVLEWNMDSPLKALNLACEDLHKGEDGLSKLWPNVEVTITCPLTIIE